MWLSWDADPSLSPSRARVSSMPPGWTGPLSGNLAGMQKQVSGRNRVMIGIGCDKSPLGFIPELGRRGPGHS